MIFALDIGWLKSHQSYVAFHAKMLNHPCTCAPFFPVATFGANVHQYLFTHGANVHHCILCRMTYLMRAGSPFLAWACKAAALADAEHL